MRINRAAVLTAACVTGLLGLPAPFAAAAEAPAVLYVDNTDPAKCSDSGEGTEAQPFCTVQKGVDSANPGQTVAVVNGTYYEGPITVTRSGESGKPLTIQGYKKPGTSLGNPGIDSPEGTPTLVLTGVHDVVVHDLVLGQGVTVSGSSQVTVDRIQESSGTFKVTGASNAVTISRSSAGKLVVDGGSTGTTLLRNTATGIRLADAPNTVVTNNTTGFSCEPGVAVTGSSTGASVYNNISRQWQASDTCPEPHQAGGITVDASATTGTKLGSNLISVLGQDTAYSWAGTKYPSQGALAAAVKGQAAGDVVQSNTYDPAAAIDSADATAPGALKPDYLGNPAADDPDYANTGKGSPIYLDRGAVERQDRFAPGWMLLKLNYGQAPYGTDIVATATNNSQSSLWPSTVVTYSFDFGDGTVVKTTDTVAHHTYTAPCDCTVTVTSSDQTTTHEPSTSQPSYIKVTTPGELTAKTTATPVVPESTNPIGYTPPLEVSVNNAATFAPWPIVSTTVDYGDGKQESFDHLDNPSHQYAMPGDYTVRTTVEDSQGKTSSASSQVHVDYAPSGFLKANPYRLVDTRSDQGWRLNGGVPGTFRIPVGPSANPVISGSIASVVLNVTVTEASEDTHLTVWPNGQPRPATSNVNVAAGKDSANLVTVPLGFENSINTVLNSGHAEIVIDVVGYYQPNVGEKFSPLAPSRLMDSRNSGGALKADTTRNVKVAGVGGVPANASAVVLNLTSTETTEDTYLTVWPHGSNRPTSSNLNPEPGKDKSNQVIVPVGPDGTVDLYNHAGSTHAVIDVFGYYGPDGSSLFTPTVPRRLADTRSGNPLGNDSTMGIATGLPATATAAVLNVTATGATDNTHLIVFADGSNRPGTSNLNIGPRQTVPNHVITPLGANGKVDIYNHTGNTQVIADLFGYFTKG